MELSASAGSGMEQASSDAKPGVSFRSRLMAERLRHKSDKICTPG